VQAYNANAQEGLKFHEKVSKVLALARKEAIASGIFFGMTGWSGNVTLLCLLGYGEANLCPNTRGTQLKGAKAARWCLAAISQWGT